MEGVVNERERIAASEPALSIAGQAMFSREEVEQLVERLKEPFDPRVVQWVVTATAGGKDGHRRGLLAAYADPRAYMDRLNQLLTPRGWTQQYSTQVSANCPRKVRDKQVASAKLLVICRLTIFGLGAHSGTGEGWADDENALTGADAQAFKRAGVSFGLGRYFYDLPQTWVDLDEHDRPRWLPELPVWALPLAMRSKANGTPGVTSKNGSGRDGSRPPNAQHGHNGQGGAATSGNGKHEALKEVEALSKQVGRSIFRSILVSVAGVDSPAQVGDVGKLKEIAERLGNAGRGVQRLKAAVGKVGLDALAAACRELKLSSTLTDDIPDTKVLRQLVDRLEQQAEALRSTEPVGQARSANKGTENDRDHAATSGMDFVALRNEVLTVARRLATASQRPIAEIVAWASEGTFQYADIGKLTVGDVSKLQAAVRRLQQAVNEPKP